MYCSLLDVSLLNYPPVRGLTSAPIHIVSNPPRCNRPFALCFACINAPHRLPFSGDRTPSMRRTLLLAVTGALEFHSSTPCSRKVSLRPRSTDHPTSRVFPSRRPSADKISTPLTAWEGDSNRPQWQRLAATRHLRAAKNPAEMGWPPAKKFTRNRTGVSRLCRWPNSPHRFLGIAQHPLPHRRHHVRSEIRVTIIIGTRIRCPARRAGMVRLRSPHTRQTLPCQRRVFSLIFSISSRVLASVIVSETGGIWKDVK